MHCREAGQAKRAACDEARRTWLGLQNAGAGGAESARIATKPPPRRRVWRLTTPRAPARRRCYSRNKSVRLDRPTKQITLRFGDAGLACEGKLLLGLDTGRDHAQPESFAERSERGDDRAITLGNGGIAQEFAVQLDAVDRDPAQRGEARRGGTEVVQYDAHPGFGKLGK